MLLCIAIVVKWDSGCLSIEKPLFEPATSISH